MREIQPLDLSRDGFLSTGMSVLEQSLVNSARRAAEEASRGMGITWTETEMEAVVTVQVLKELNSVDLAALLLRYKYVRKIQDRNFVTRHPGQYTSLAHLANDQGISTAELSRIVDLVEIVFPYLGNVLGMDVPTLWKEVGKSNFFDMLPVLKVLITGDETERSQQANEAARRFLDDAAATYREQGMEVPEEDALRQEVVQDIVERGSLLTNRELRTHLRPERIPNIDTYVFIDGDQSYALMPITEDQMEMLARRAGACLDVTRFDFDSGQFRKDEVVRTPFLRTFLRMWS